MRRLFSLVIVLLCLCSCKDKANTFILEGHVGHLQHDTLYIYGADALYERIDTVLAKEGAFRYVAKVDTVTPLWVLFPNRHREMVFGDKGLVATMQGDTAAFGHIHIVGGKHNALLQEFYHRTDSVDNAKELITIADSFIRANPYSEVSIYLLREYFVHKLHPENTKIKTLIGSMSGNLQDNNYIQQLQRALNSYRPLAKNNVASTYNVRDSEGKNVNTSEYKDTYLLIQFWASWDAESRQRQRELIALKEKYKEHNFDILSVSLDTDREAWLQAIREDSVTWRQACDLVGWKTDIVKNMQVAHLPYNLLLSPSRRIQDINIYGDALDARVWELTEERNPKKKDKKAEKKVEVKPERKTPSTIREMKIKN